MNAEWKHRSAGEKDPLVHPPEGFRPVRPSKGLKGQRARRAGRTGDGRRLHEGRPRPRIGGFGRLPFKSLFEPSIYAARARACRSRTGTAFAYDMRHGRPRPACPRPAPTLLKPDGSIYCARREP